MLNAALNMTYNSVWSKAPTKPIIVFFVENGRYLTSSRLFWLCGTYYVSTNYSESELMVNSLL